MCSKLFSELDFSLALSLYFLLLFNALDMADAMNVLRSSLSAGRFLAPTNLTQPHNPLPQDEKSCFRVFALSLHYPTQVNIVFGAV